MVTNENMLAFLNQKFWTTFEEENIDSIKDFVLIWNVFDDKCFKSNFEIAKVAWFLHDKNLDFKWFTDHLLYFRERYVKDGKFTDKYELHFRKGDNEALVKDTLLWNTSDQDKLITWMLIIIYRYRNNLFHGLKEFWRLDSQRENFIVANNLLRTILNQVL